MKANRGQVTFVNWRTRGSPTDAVYAECKRILSELRMNTDPLEEWRAKVLRSEKDSFRAETSEADPTVRVDIRSISRLDGVPVNPAEIEWALSVDVEWKEGGR